MTAAAAAILVVGVLTWGTGMALVLPAENGGTPKEDLGEVLVRIGLVAGLIGAIVLFG